jgi:hypothetical protein
VNIDETLQDCSIRPPRLRFTVRRMMVVVAILAVILSVAGGLWRRSNLYRLAAKAEEVAALETAGSLKTTPLRGKQLILRKLMWHVRRHDIYYRVAEHPWLSVEPDPPEPKITGSDEL